MRLVNKFKWYDPASSVKNTLTQGHNSVTFKEALFRVGAGRLDTPAQAPKSNTISLSDWGASTRQDSFNHLGIYDYLTAGVLYVLESFLRGNYLQSNKGRTIMYFAAIPLWGPLTLVRAVVGGLLGLLAAPIIALLGDRLVKNVRIVDLQSDSLYRDPRDMSTSNPPTASEASLKRTPKKPVTDSEKQPEYGLSGSLSPKHR